MKYTAQNTETLAYTHHDTFDAALNACQKYGPSWQVIETHIVDGAYHPVRVLISS